MKFSRHVGFGVGLLTILLAANTTAFAQDDVEKFNGKREKMPVQDVKITSEWGIDGEMQTVEDSPSRRAEWFRHYYGPVSNDFLDYKILIAEEEHAKWAHTIPGTPEFKSLYPGLSPYHIKMPGVEKFMNANVSMPSNLWYSIGPWDGSSVQNATRNRNIVDMGRPTAILPHPTDPNILYLAQGGGGVWVCKNATLDNENDWIWTPITDNLPGAGNQSIGSMDFKPGDPNTIYMSLGDTMFGSANQTADGRGFYITKDAGETWIKGGDLGPRANRSHAVLALEGDIVLVTTNFGLFRSTDGGLSFTRVQSGPFQDGTGVHDDPGNVAQYGNADYATTWDIIKLDNGDLVATYQFCDGNSKYGDPNAFSGYGSFSGGGIAYSTDKGVTWTKAAVDITGRSANSIGFGRIDIAASGNTIYGLAQNGSYPLRNTTEFVMTTVPSGNIRTIIRSTDGGRNWHYVPASATTGNRLFTGTGAYTGDGGQSGYNQMIAADPYDPTNMTVFVGTNLAMWKSIDGGTNWTCISHWLASGREYTHADMHVAVWTPPGAAKKALYVATDGGLSIIRDPDATTWTGTGVVSTRTKIDHRRNFGQASHLIYGFGNTNATVPEGSKDRIIAGYQDLGTGTRRSDSEGNNLPGYATANGSPNFYDYVLGGDGFDCLIHRSHGNWMLGSLYDTRISRHSNGGINNSNWTTLTPSGTDPAGTPFFTRIFQGWRDDDIFTFKNSIPYRSVRSNYTPVGTTVEPGGTVGIWSSATAANSWQAMTTTVASGYPRAYLADGTQNTAAAAPSIRSMGASEIQDGLVGITFDVNRPAIGAVGTPEYQQIRRGTVAISEDRGNTWRFTTGIPNNPANLHDIVFDTKNPDIIYLCGVRPAVWNNAGRIDGHLWSHIWKSTDKGLSFMPIDGKNWRPVGPDNEANTMLIGDPNGFPFGSLVHMVRVDPQDNNVVYAATDYGLYRSIDQGGNWERWGVGLPMVSVRAIYIAPDSSFMRVATHGRGVWEMSNAAPEQFAPTINSQPKNITVDEGDMASFMVIADGVPAPTYQWQVSTGEGLPWLDIERATGNVYYTGALGLGDSGKQYRVFVRNDKGAVNSNPATVTVNAVVPPDPNTPVNITNHPSNQSVMEGERAIFQAGATGSPSPTFQWQTSPDGAVWSNIYGAVGNVHVTDVVVAADNGKRFRMVATNVEGSVPTNAATLNVFANPNVAATITSSPQNVTVKAGETAIFTASGMGTPIPIYSWEVSTDDGDTWDAIPDISGNVYVIGNATVGDSGKMFRMTATNVMGHQTSSPATLTVTPTFSLNSTEPGVGVFDFLTFLSMYGSTDPAHLAIADFNGDGVIDDADLILLLNQF